MLKEINFYGMLNTGLLACVALFTIGGVMQAFEPEAGHLLGVAFLTVAVNLWAYAFRRRKVVTLLITGGLLAGFCLLAGLENVGAFLGSYLEWMAGTGERDETLVKGFALLHMLLLVILSYLLELLMEKRWILKPVAGAIVGIVLVLNMVTKGGISLLGVVICGCFLVFILLEWIELKWQKVKLRDSQTYMLWMFPFILLFGILLYQFPVSEEPYDWKFVREAYDLIEEQTLSLRDGLFETEDVYDLSLSGFSEDGSLNGSLFTTKKEIMEIRSGTLNTNLFLCGKTFNEFDGRNWQALQEEIPKEQYIDTAQNLWSVMSYDPGYTFNYLRKANLTVTYKNTRTDHVFLPIKLWSTDVGFANEDGSLLMEKHQGAGFTYEAEFYQINIDNEIYYDFLDGEYVIDENAKAEVIERMLQQCKISITQEEIDAYEKAVYRDYTAAVSLSPKVKAYLAEVTADAETDVEKLRAIEAELASFTYTTEPGKMPATVKDSESFLDYFLLEGREGYCTYYATAFALLAREMGFPTRYVQGYYVSTDQTGVFSVRSNMAHAWPEVYFEGVGWIPFEPTPGYGAARYTPWKLIGGEGAAEDSAVQGTTGGSGSGNGAEQRPEAPVDATPEDAPETELEQLSFGEAMQAAGVVVLVAVTLLAAAVMAIRMGAEYTFTHKNGEERYHILVRRNLIILQKQGLQPGRRETLSEFCRRAEEELTGLNCLGFIHDYEDVIYGTRPIDEGINNVLKEENAVLLEELKKKNEVGYWWYKLWEHVYGLWI